MFLDQSELKYIDERNYMISHQSIEIYLSIHWINALLSVYILDIKVRYISNDTSDI